MKRETWVPEIRRAQSSGSTARHRPLRGGEASPRLRVGGTTAILQGCPKDSADALVGVSDSRLVEGWGTLVRIAEIQRGSIAEELELQIGTRVVRINGEKVRDGIDLTFLLADEALEMETVAPDGNRAVYEIHRDPGEAVGIVPAPDTVRECANKCVFCFIDGNPKDVRPSLWIRDDDFRLSFSYGSYVTLTNLGDRGLARLVEQRLLPSM